MISKPTIFENNHRTVGAEIHAVVEIISVGSVRMYFSDTSMMLDGYKVFPYLITPITIKEELDPYRKDWNVSDCDIDIVNAYYNKGSGGGYIYEVQMSDVLDNYRGGTLKIYLLAGSNCTSLTDGILRYSGYIDTNPTYTRDTVTISSYSLEKTTHKELPQRIISDEYPNAPLDFALKKIPIVYGKYSGILHDYPNDKPSYNGLAVAVPVSNDYPPNIVVSDHICDALTNGKLYFKIKDLSLPCQSVGGNVTLDDSGLTTYIPSITTNAYLEFGDASEIAPVNSSHIWGTGLVDDYLNTIDNDLTTYAVVYDHYDGGSEVVSYAYFTIINADWLNKKFPNYSIVGRASFVGTGSGTASLLTTGGNHTYVGTVFYEVEIDGTSPDTYKWQAAGGGWTTTVAIGATANVTQELGSNGVFIKWPVVSGHVLGDRWTFYAGVPKSGQTMYDLDIQYKVYDVSPSGWSFSQYNLVDIKEISFTNVMSWEGVAIWADTDLTSSSSATTYYAKDMYIGLGDDSFDGILLRFDQKVDGDGTADNLALGRIYSHRLRARFYAVSSEYTNSFVGCDGRAYGSWITGRSSNYSAGDCIEDPAGIIESILRDELGYADAQINMPSFITAENTAVKSRINLHSNNKLRSDIAIRQLAEQSTFAYCFTAAGKSRLIKMNAAPASVDKEIQYGWIKNGEIKVSTSRYLINKMDVNSRWQEEYDDFIDSDIYENSTSQTAYGLVNDYSANWKNICGTSSDHVANHLIRKADGTATDGDGLWANEHFQITFTTFGFTCAEVEIGDWISIVGIDLYSNIQPRLYGNTFTNVKFLVRGIIQKAGETQITAIELF